MATCLVVTRRKRNSVRQRDGQLAGFDEEEKYFQFNYPSSDLNDMSTPLIAHPVHLFKVLNVFV